MARSQLRLDEFQRVVGVMRELGVASWVNSPLGDIVLGQAPPPRPAKADKDPHRERRTYYAEVLGHRVSDDVLEKLP